MMMLLLLILLIGGLVFLTAGAIAGVACAVYGIIAYFASYLGLIPFIGPAIYFLVMHFGVEPMLSDYLVMGLATGILYWLFFVISLIYCCITTFITIMAILEG